LFRWVPGFEAARRLTLLGEEVAAVILIDVAAPGYPKVTRGWKNYFRLAAQVASGRRQVSWKELRGHFAVLSGLIRRQPSALASPATVPEPVPPLLHPNVEAGRRYDPKPFGCHLVQIAARGAEHTTEILDDPRLGWRDLATGSFTVLDVHGVGEELYRQPMVAKLADRIDSVLSAVNKRHSRTHQPVGATINE
jgi:thioesterase domain-containing protein